MMPTLAWAGIGLFIGAFITVIYLLFFKRVRPPSNYRVPATKITPKAYTDFGDKND